MIQIIKRKRIKKFNSDSSTKVSVIISTYNNPLYLERVLDGFLHQSKLPAEIIIADDGSDFDTEVLIKNYQKNSKVQIKHVWQKKDGFRKAMILNKAIAISSSEYLILCDGDSIPSKQMVEDHLNYAERGYFIQGHRVLISPKTSKTFTFKDITFLKLLKFSLIGEIKNFFNILRIPFPIVMVSRSLKGIRGCNMSFFKKDFLAVNGFNEDFWGWGREDSELVVRFFKYGLKRKDLRFRAICFHLWHPHCSRDNLENNDKLLEASKKSPDFRCKNGIEKYLKIL